MFTLLVASEPVLANDGWGEAKLFNYSFYGRFLLVSLCSEEVAVPHLGHGEKTGPTSD